MTDLPTGEQLEAVFYAALEANDIDGVLAALQVMTTVDVNRAARLMEALQEALALAQMLNRLATDSAEVGQ